MPFKKEKLEDTKQRLRRRCGKLILDALDDPNVIEIMLNPRPLTNSEKLKKFFFGIVGYSPGNGALWIEKLGKSMECIGSITENNAQGILEQVAAYHGLVVNADNPILECEFPLDGSRFEGLYPPVVAQASFALRKKAVSVFTLEDYVAQGIMTQRQKEVITIAVRNKKNILVIGGTSSGKTTLVNAIIACISEECPDDRIISMEDTAELQIESKNTVSMYSSVKISLATLLKATLRLRPDRIIVGEVRDGTALDLLKAWNTGHPGGTATIHANDAYAGLTRMVSCISENSNAPRVIEPLVAEAANIAVCIGKDHDGKRRIREILEVGEWNFTTQKFRTTPIV